MTLLKSLRMAIAFSRLAVILFISISMSLFTSLAQAQNEGRWYNVEILIFKRLDASIQTQELWRNDLSLSYPDRYRYLRSPKANPKSHLSLLTSDSYVLNRYKNALRRNEKFQILKHMAWSQQMQNEKRSPSIIISGGKQIGNRQELEGYIKIHIARFLHVTSNLWLTEDITSNTDVRWPSLPERPSLANAGRTHAENKRTENDSTVFEELEKQFGIERNSPYPIITLQNRRRMRSNELHYIDHPSMGIMVFMTPLN